MFFVDDNIISNRAYARELLPRLAEFKLKWFSHASMNIAKDAEMLELCQRSGCIGLVHRLRNASRRRTCAPSANASTTREEYLEAVQRIHDHGIGIDASFVFGLDADDEGVFDRTLDVRGARQDRGGLLFDPDALSRHAAACTAERRKDRILTRDWSLYDTSHVVYRPRTFTPDQLLAGYHRVIKESFSLGSIFGRLWGTTAYKPFFYPMNFGFRRSARALGAAYRAGHRNRPLAGAPAGRTA